MATTYQRRDYDLLRSDSRLRWPAIIAGFFAAVAVQLVLLAIGGAIGISGLTAVYHPGTLQGLNIAAGIWTVLSPIVSLFVGGMVAVMLARPLDRRMASFHGGMVWCLSMILGGAIVLAIAAPSIGGTLGGATAGTTSGVAAAETTNHPRTALKKADHTKATLDRRLDKNGNGTSKDEQLDTEKTAAKAGSGVAWGTVIAMLLGFAGSMFGALSGHTALFGRPDSEDRAVSTTTTEEEHRIVTPPEVTSRDYDRPELH
jgi:hypothetical protein